MKTMKTTTLLTSSLALLSSLSATSIFQEGFNYGVGELEANSSGTWTDQTFDNRFSITAKTWASIDDNYAGAIDNFQVSPGSGGGNQARISLGTTINTEISNTVYFSYLMNGDSVAGGGWYNFVLRNNAATDTSKSLADNAFVQFNGGPKNFTASDFGTVTDTNYDNQDILVVGRMDFASGQDTGYLSIFTNGEDMQTLLDNESNAGANFGFEATSNPTITGSLDTLTLRVNNTTATGSIRIGTTLADVGVVPEPSSYALLAGVVALGAMTLRRRR